MSSSAATLTSLWVDDSGSPVKTVNLGTPSKGELKEEFERYFRENDDLGPLAKQAGIIDTNGELVTAGTSSGVATRTIVTKPAQIKPAQTILQKPNGPTYLYVSTSGNNVIARPLIQQQVGTVASGQRLTVLANPGSGTGGGAVAIPVSLDSRKRPLESPGVFSVSAFEDESKRVRKTEKGSKGLRHFSMKVCEKVQRKGVTTYNEVADELVQEFTDPRFMQTEQAQYDQKNIRRRVYDALNVLMAMNIISKEKKEIRWIGLPTNSAQECQNLEIEKTRRMERIEHKQQQLQELVLQQIAYKNLVQRNKSLESEYGTPPENSSIQLPFVIVNTDKKTVIDCSISNDKYEYLFNFDNTFEIHDDIEVLKRMGLTLGLENGSSSQEDIERAVSMVPPSLEHYVRTIAQSATDKQKQATSHAPVAPNKILETATVSKTLSSNKK